MTAPTFTLEVPPGWETVPSEFALEAHPGANGTHSVIRVQAIEGWGPLWTFIPAYSLTQRGALLEYEPGDLDEVDVPGAISASVRTVRAVEPPPIGESMMVELLAGDPDGTVWIVVVAGSAGTFDEAVARSILDTFRLPVVDAPTPI